MCQAFELRQREEKPADVWKVMKALVENLEICNIRGDHMVSVLQFHVREASNDFLEALTWQCASVFGFSSVSLKCCLFCCLCMAPKAKPPQVPLFGVYFWLLGSAV